MDIAGVGTSAVTASSYSKTRQSLSVRQTAVPEDVRERRGDDDDRPRRRGRSDGDFALGALRTEIRAALKQVFKIASAIGSYAPAASRPGDVVGETLSAASKAAAESPLDARDELAKLRSEVAAAGDAVKGVIDNEDLDGVETAIAKIEKGLAPLEAEAARNTESSASFLSAETRTKQRSTIRIKTQEGDIVRLDLRRRESFEANDVALRSGDGSFTSTEVSVSSKTRLAFSVKGDLNEQELAAIQTVFDQASAIADDFFGGDMAAAFSAASSLSYDTEQLSRVSLKMRERTVSNVSFGSVVDSRPSIPAAAFPGVSLPAPAVASADARAPSPAETIDSAVIEPTDAVNTSPAVVPAAEKPTEPEVAADNFGASLAGFLRDTLEGFENGDGKRYFYSESFKLQLLSTAIQVAAGEGDEAAADNAAAVVNAVAGDSDDRDDD